MSTLDSGGERAAVLNTLYVAFAEGFSRPLDQSPILLDLTTEAISLIEALLPRPGWACPESHALSALFYLQGSRLPARIANADFVRFVDQDRSLWRFDWIPDGMRQMAFVMDGSELSRHHIEVAIAACYVSAVEGGAPPWDRILSLYDELLVASQSPRLQRCRARAIPALAVP